MSPSTGVSGGHTGPWPAVRTGSGANGCGPAADAGLRRVGAMAHPLMDVATEEAPVLPDLGGRQLAEPRQLVDGGFGDPQKAGHVHDRQNFAVRC
ncbi:hypothetical protein NITMOv2_2142 [Nitrospira moscoviensis]|uniref:Uncharacterized protein n=1 Tax=Nitrospira moscoviensis TaxID=42253 RepID=A0A0K2GCH5_NITMO|nr:hypothetical protein NITMOv2_2142 [Nitrospira moscoviensis]